MMINKRLIQTVDDSKKYIAGNVICQWCSLVSNIAMIFSISYLIQKMAQRDIRIGSIAAVILTAGISLVVRYVCTAGANRMSYLASKTVKKVLRSKIYEKLLKIGASYHERVPSSEVVQVSVEGVEQLETYFGSYLPQFFYSMLAPLTLFIVLSFVSFSSALVLFLCVPLIPAAIAAVQTFAKKLLSKYWGQYTAMGDLFLENLQGLTTLKIYEADQKFHERMKEEAEKFRKITMRVLTMQLNSITIMDLVAYGGAALGVILGVLRYQSGQIEMAGCLAIILLSADFFIPMRQLGSFFHIAMNGMAASEKIFKILDLPEETEKNKKIDPKHCAIVCQNVHFSYEKGRKILKGIDLECPMGSFTALVGESGCGKSTIAGILSGSRKGYTGSITIGGLELSKIKEESLMKQITYVGHNNYLFKGTVRENLLMGKEEATEEQLWEVLEKTKLADFLRTEKGLDTILQEEGSNFSGGQRQRLSLARALLHDSPIYIFDEATSNIDVESENDIMEQIKELAKRKTVLLISHRLANVESADQIFVLEDGQMKEHGTQQELLEKHETYEKLWNSQQILEQYGKEQKTKHSFFVA